MYTSLYPGEIGLFVFNAPLSFFGVPFIFVYFMKGGGGAKILSLFIPAILSLIILSFFCAHVRGKVQMSQELIEVLQRKSNFHDPENRIIVAFKTATDPEENLQKIPLQLLGAEEYRAAIGSLIFNEMLSENWELEQELLEYVEEDQIIRKLPIGNAFILEGLDYEQAQKVSQLERTVLLTLSTFTPNSRSIKRSKPAKNCDALNKCAVKEAPKSNGYGFLFNEPVWGLQKWSKMQCNSLHKAGCESSAQFWNHRQIKSDQVWSNGFKGKGIIYGIIDTGVSYKHPVLKENYLGRRPNGAFDHNYAWYDAVRTEPKLSRRDRKQDVKLDRLEEQIHQQLESSSNPAPLYKTHRKLNRRPIYDGYEADISSSSSSGSSSSSSSDDEDEGSASHTEGVMFEPMEKIMAVVDQCSYGVNEPCDAGGHGTHVTSTAVGNFGFGVAPDAQWMACRSIANDLGREEDSLACLNFLLAPHDLNGNNPRPELRPHVIGNSYGWESWAEVTGAGIDLAVRRLESAGTVMVFAAGNSGPECGTIHSAFSFTVGATTEQGTLAIFSSRGPWTISPQLARRQLENPYNPILVKPDISAPGHQIVGAIGSLHTAKMSGTSMATPHVSGAVALLRKQTLNIFNIYTVCFFSTSLSEFDWKAKASSASSSVHGPTYFRSLRSFSVWQGQFHFDSKQLFRTR